MIRDAKALRLPLATFVASMAVWHICSVQLGWGEAAAEHDPASIWSYVKKLSMIALALGLPLIAGYGKAGSYGWRITLPWLAIAVVIGLAQGWANREGFDIGLFAVLNAGLHSFAIEIYFRAYLINAFKKSLQRFLAADILIGPDVRPVSPQRVPGHAGKPFRVLRALLYGARRGVWLHLRQIRELSRRMVVSLAGGDTGHTVSDVSVLVALPAKRCFALFQVGAALVNHLLRMVKHRDALTGRGPLFG